MSGNDESEEGRPFRRPLYLPPEEAPYTPEQLQALRDAYASAAGGDTFDRHWLRVRDEARKCEKALDDERMWEPHRNVWWRINDAVQEGKVAELVKTHPEDAHALLYGAMRAGLVSPIKATDFGPEFSQLKQLLPDELQTALIAAKAEGSILWKARWRPSGGPIENFSTFLGKLYVETTGRPLSASKSGASGEYGGPAIRFMRAGRAPFPPELSSAGLRSLIHRIRSRLKKP